MIIVPITSCQQLQRFSDNSTLCSLSLALYAAYAVNRDFNLPFGVSVVSVILHWQCLSMALRNSGSNTRGLAVPVSRDRGTFLSWVKAYQSLTWNSSTHIPLILPMLAGAPMPNLMVIGLTKRSYHWAYSSGSRGGAYSLRATCSGRWRSMRRGLSYSALLLPPPRSDQLLSFRSSSRP